MKKEKYVICIFCGVIKLNFLKDNFPFVCHNCYKFIEIFDLTHGEVLNLLKQMFSQNKEEMVPLHLKTNLKAAIVVLNDFTDEKCICGNKAVKTIKVLGRNACFDCVDYHFKFSCLYLRDEICLN